MQEAIEILQHAKPEQVHFETFANGNFIIEMKTPEEEAKAPSKWATIAQDMRKENHLKGQHGTVRSLFQEFRDNAEI